MTFRHCRTLSLLTLLLAGVVSPFGPLMAQPPAGTDAEPFSRQWLEDHARRLATRPFESQELAADSPLRALDYDDYRRIVFDADAAIWRDEGLPFRLQLFHPGFLHTTPVGLHLVDDERSQRIPFTTRVFDYHESLAEIEGAEAGGYAGFRVHYPINTPQRHEEFLVFLGASYFRGVGHHQFYGLSARGLAVNTVGPGDEEFPRFSDFWIERPAPDAGRIVIHALLDSPSLTGAYRFTVEPGEATRLDVEATLYPRKDLRHYGIAPLTSMFLFDATNQYRFDDFRNAVHDSEGLLIQQHNGEVVWRPLANPSQVQVSSFGEQAPAGFGLMQRHKAFDRFNDDEARYDRRPSLWIEPLGDWGEGQVELLEIPTREEIHDNIVAYWQPGEALQAGGEYRYRYRLYWGAGAPGETPGRVVETAAGAVPGSTERLFVIDYSDAAQIPGLASDPEALRVHATTSAGRITDISGTLVEASGRYRAYIKFDPQGESLAELRVTLEAGGAQWGETWLYRWTP